MGISKKSLALNIILMLLLISLAVSICCIPQVTYAEETGILQEDGLYYIRNYDVSNLKAKDYIQNAYVEKFGDNYYFSLQFSKQVTSCKIGESNIKYGTKYIESNNTNEYIFTVTKEMLLSPIKIILRGEEIQNDTNLASGFTFNIAQSSLKNKTGKFRDFGERPALYEADFENAAGSENIEIGTEYKLPRVTATLGGKPIDVQTKVYHRANEDAQKQLITVKNNSFIIAEHGQYIIEYKVESADYKTSFGNNLVDSKEAIINVVDKIDLPCKKDGIYLVKYKFDAKMGKEYFRDTVVVEKTTVNGKAHYFVTISVGYQTDTGMDAMKDIELLQDDVLIGTEGPWIDNDENINLLYGGKTPGGNKAYKNITYSVPENMLKRRLSFKGTVPIVGLRVGFGVILNTDVESWSFVQSDLLNLNRPAEYLPLLKVVAGKTEKEKGSTVSIPKATATILDEVIDVDIKVTYGNGEPVSINNNKFVLEKEGSYYITFTATSSKVTDINGNYSTSKITSEIVSKVGAKEPVRVVDRNGILTTNEHVEGLELNKDTQDFRQVKALIETVTDKKKENRYVVYGLVVVDEHGNEVSLEGRDNIYVALALKDEYKEKNVKVYLLDDNKLVQQNVNFEDGYAVLNTNKTGTYVVVEEGYKLSQFQKMMIGGGVGGALLIILIIVIIVVVVLKVKKKKKEQLEGDVEDDDIAEDEEDEESEEDDDNSEE